MALPAAFPARPPHPPRVIWGSWDGVTLELWGSPALLRGSGMGAGAFHGCGGTARLPESSFLQGTG